MHCGPSAVGCLNATCKHRLAMLILGVFMIVGVSVSFWSMRNTTGRKTISEANTALRDRFGLGVESVDVLVVGRGGAIGRVSSALSNLGLPISSYEEYHFGRPGDGFTAKIYLRLGRVTRIELVSDDRHMVAAESWAEHFRKVAPRLPLRYEKP